MPFSASHGTEKIVHAGGTLPDQAMAPLEEVFHV
jgi:hypothetical protein